MYSPLKQFIKNILHMFLKWNDKEKNKVINNDMFN